MPQAPCTPRRAGDSARHPDHPARPPRPQTATPAGHGTSTAREPPCPLWQRLARHAWDDPQDARPFSARLRHTTGWSAAHIQRVLVEGTSKKDANELAGRTDNNRIVNFAGNPRLINTFVDVRITEALPHSLRGEIVIREN